MRRRRSRHDAASASRGVRPSIGRGASCGPAASQFSLDCHVREGRFRCLYTGDLLVRPQVCHDDRAMAISNMMRDVETLDDDPQGDPNSEEYWAERGLKRPQLVWERLSSSNNIE